MTVLALSTNDILAIVFGIATVITGAAAIYFTRRYRMQLEPDAELGLIGSQSSNGEFEQAMPSDNAQGSSIYHSNKIIGDTLELFSKHLRTHG